MDNQRLGEVLWESLYGDLPEGVPDPNQPENTARINAERDLKKKQFQDFYNGPGKPFFDQLKTEIRMSIFNLLTASQEYCGCTVCQQLREVVYRAQLLAKAQDLASK